MNWSIRSALLVAVVGCSHALVSGAQATAASVVGEPRVFVYASPGGVDLKAFVFSSN